MTEHDPNAQLPERDVSDSDESSPDSASSESRDSQARSRPKGGLFGNLQSLAIAILLALFLRTFLFAAYKIPSGSMIPTLLIGDQLIVNKISYGAFVPFTDHKIFIGKLPERGDIMVFRYPEDTHIDFIKRVIGLPGDHIRLVGHQLFINGKQVQTEPAHPYQAKDADGRTRSAVRYIETLGGHTYNVLYDELTAAEAVWLEPFEVTVPEGHYFMMGDNRDRSNDSRGWGFVPIENMVGHPMLIHFSWDSQNNAIRFGRMFDSVE